jgi:hypothetical protein
MARRDLISEVTDIVHPLPGPPSDDASEEERDGWDSWARTVQEERDEFQTALGAVWEHADTDPLLYSIQAAREDMREAEHRMRLLITYGREFTQPRPYKLDDLARSAGMSVSGIRTAYDNGQIIEVAQLIGAKLRPADERDDHTSTTATDGARDRKAEA